MIGRSGWILAAVAATACLAGGGPAAQPGAPPRWVENFDFQVEIDGAVSSRARLFSGRTRGAMLIVAPELPDALIVLVDAREVRRVALETVALPEGGETAELSEASIQGPPSPYTMDGDAVIFFENGQRVRIARRAPLIGDIALPDLLARLPLYRKGMEAYAPSDSDLAYLKGYGLEVRVHVFFGSWCPHCRQTVPQFLKSLDAAANGRIQTLLTAVPKPFSDFGPAKESGVKGVPTFIIYSGDREIGRFSAIPEGSSVEHELVKILYAHEQARG
ncbi:MAG TPA: thioredoxin family protein [Candidatus Polarisedimenticolia bacterium]|nr:thioredoxin family protein [Candidatus Polarisedimenticolia bacterium]